MNPTPALAATKILQKPLPTACYFPEARIRDGALIHFTAGPSAIGAWSQFKSTPGKLGYPVSVPYVVETNGDVWQLYPDVNTGYHIGIADPAFAQNHRHDWRLIGIEVANIGPLTLGQDGESLTWNGGTILYGRIDDPNCPPYVKLDAPYRGISYFAKFPDAQVAATVALVDMLQKKYNFPRVIPPLQRALHGVAGLELNRVTTPCRFACDLPYFTQYKGVCSHVNFIDHWKWDQAPTHSDAIWTGLSAIGFKESQ